MRSATAFAPGNISGVFKIIPDDDPAKMHSLGLGLTVAQGVTVTVSEADTPSVRFNGEAIQFPTAAAVASKLSDRGVTVDVVSPLPLSAGFGLSGATALATAYALDTLLGLERSEAELALTAHIAEVENLSGLGDVCAQYHGGCLVKLKPGDPLAAQRLAVAEQPIHYRFFGPISTREVLSDPQRGERVNAAAAAALEALGELTDNTEVELAECIRISLRFAEASTLLTHPQVVQTIRDVEKAGGAASMIMLGDAVFSTLPFAGSEQTSLATDKARRVVET